MFKSINKTILCSPHKRTIQTCLGIIEKYPRNTFTIRLEPLLKEQFFAADTVPMKAAELKQFCADMEKQHGVKIVYGDPMLNLDNWVPQIMTNKAYA